MKAPAARSRTRASLIGMSLKAKSSISLASGSLAIVSWYLIERAYFSIVTPGPSAAIALKRAEVIATRSRAKKDFREARLSGASLDNWARKGDAWNMARAWFGAW